MSERACPCDRRKVRAFASCKHLLLKKDCGNSGAPSLSSIPYSVIRVEIEQRPSNSSSSPCLFCVDFLSFVWGPWHPYLDKTMWHYSGIPHTQTSPMALPKIKRIIKSVCVCFHFPLQRVEKYGQKTWPLVIALEDSTYSYILGLSYRVHT